MNKRNKNARAATTLDRKAHYRIKILAAKTGTKIEALIDDAVFSYLKSDPLTSAPLRPTVK